MNEPDLMIELRYLRQAISDLTTIMTDKMDLNGPAVLDIREAANYLSTTRRALYALVKRGGIPCRRIGKKIIFPKTDLDAWLDQIPGFTVAQAIQAIKPEHREMWVKGSVRIRSYEDPPTPEPLLPFVRGAPRHHAVPQVPGADTPESAPPTTLRRGREGANRQRIKAERTASQYKERR